MLRINNQFPSRGTQKGDVYSFGIVLYEMIGRKGPWGYDISDEYIIDHVMNPDHFGGIMFRPSTHGLKCASYIICCVRKLKSNFMK